MLHGFGFAAVLREIGLPQTELPTALLFFNVGVELGQILFVVASLGIYLAIKAVAARPAMAFATAKPKPTVAAGYAIGSVASYWSLDRVAGFWV